MMKIPLVEIGQSVKIKLNVPADKLCYSLHFYLKILDVEEIYYNMMIDTIFRWFNINCNAIR